MNRINIETGVGIFLVIGLISLGFLSVKLGGVNLFGAQHYSVKARFSNISGLKEGATVEIAGVQIGKVARIDLDDYDAVVEMDIDHDVKLQEDSIASIRTQGIIGDKFIKIKVGGSDDYIEDGGEIIETESAIELEEDRTLRMVLTGDLLFDSGRATLLPTAQGELRQIARLLAGTKYRITVVGHTDNRPIKSEIFPSNWELSAARAATVARFLIEETGLPAARFQVSGFAGEQPLAANDSAEGRARNRRVEIVVSRADVTTEPISISTAGTVRTAR